MITLFNLNSNNPFHVQYTVGSKVFYKQIPANKVVGMKGLKTIDQVKNLSFLQDKDIEIYHYESNTYYSRNYAVPTGLTKSYAFVGDNIKSNEIVKFNNGYSGSTTQSGMTISIANANANRNYKFVTSANTVMANNTISAATIGYDTYVSFSGSSFTTAQWYGSLTGTSSNFSTFGITVTGYGATLIKSSSTVTFYLSASTQAINSGLVGLQTLVNS